METLLLTGTIAPKNDVPLLKVKDPLARYAQYKETIMQYIQNSHFDQIIFCENSGYKIPDQDFLSATAKKHKKNIEILQFEGNKNTRQGRWWWESEILEYAIKNSVLLQSAKNFYKITWRYRCTNINKILQENKDKDICFCKMMPSVKNCIHTSTYTMINTALFKTTKKFFEQYLVGAGDEVHDDQNIFLEHIYYHRIKNHTKEIHHLSRYPEFEGKTWGWANLKKNICINLIIQIIHTLWINKI